MFPSDSNMFLFFEKKGVFYLFLREVALVFSVRVYINESGVCIKDLSGWSSMIPIDSTLLG